MAMKKIRTEEQSLISASLHLSSYKRVIEELVYNALDAESSSIAIRVCMNNKIIQVLDNGTGIAKNDLRLIGHKYITSKLTNHKSKSNKYGYKGISLACIVELSKNIKITSKCGNSQETWLKKFRNGITEEFCVTISRPSKGTTVEISGFLHNLKIQQKSIDSINELNNIKIFLEQLSLVHCNVSMSLRNDSNDEIVFKIHKNRDLYQTLWSLFEISRNDIQDLQVEKNQYKIKAYICKNNIKFEKYWIYLNGRIIFKSMLHKKVNELLSKELMHKITNKKLKEKKNFKDENYFFKNKIPFYFIFISCPDIDFDICYNNKQTHVEFKNWADINRLIEKLIKFYFGDMSKIVNNVNNMEKLKKEDNETRKKVKEIMEKILKNNENKNKISQLQNGVKGKQIKRNLKKKKDSTLQKLLYKNSENSLYESNNFIDFTISNEICRHKKIDANISKLRKKNIKNNTIKTKIPIEYDNKNKHVNIQKKNKINRKQIVTETLLQKFKMPTDSILKRCEKLSDEVQNVLDINNYQNNEVHENNVYQNITFNNNSVIAFHIESNEFNLRHSKEISKNVFTQKQMRISYSKSDINNIKKSYDLLKTTEYSEIPSFIPESISYKQTTQECYFSYKSIYPYSTFNSHTKNIKRYNKNNHQYIQQISHKKNSPILNKAIEKAKHSKTNNHTEFDLLKKTFLNERNHKLCYKSNSKNNKNDAVEIHSNECRNDTENIESKNIITYNLDTANKYFNSGNTYTIDILNTLHNNDEVNATYSVLMSTKLTYNNETEEAVSFISKKDMNPRKDINLVSPKNLNENIDFENDAYYSSHSTSKSKVSDKTIEPIRYCKAILNSNEMRDVQEIFDISNFDKTNSYIIEQDNHYNPHHNDDTEVKSQYFCDHKKNDIHYCKNTENPISNTFNDQSDNHSYSIAQNIYKPLNNLLDANNNDNIIIEEFKINSRHSFVPKGMSQIFKNDCNRKDNFFNIDQKCYEDVVYKQFAENVLNKIDILESSVKNVKDIDVRDLTKANGIVKKHNADLIFNSESLKHAKILAQVDLKFIATKIKGRSFDDGHLTEYLTFFDQHAVDERISLERNLSEYINGKNWTSVPLETITLKLTEENYFYLYNYKEKFFQFGFDWIFGDKEIFVQAIPKALLGKNHRKADVIVEAIKHFLSEQIDVIQLQRGNVSLYPKSIMELVFSEACRYAIKFGDRLSKNDCVKMLQALANCKTPFQCAHGRPVIAVIMELSNNVEPYTINSQSLKKFKNNFVTK